MAQRTKSPAITVRLLREGIIESVHHVQAVVCDSRGRVLSVAGDAEHPTFIRSALKPFQAIAVTSNGILERYQLSDRDLAIVGFGPIVRIDKGRHRRIVARQPHRAARART